MCLFLKPYIELYPLKVNIWIANNRIFQDFGAEIALQHKIAEMVKGAVH